MRKFLVLVFGLSFIFVASAFAKTQPASTATKVKYFIPFHKGRLDKNYKIEMTSSGNCIGSLASPRLDAWRCFAGNGIYDPCFKQNEEKLICFLSPWEKEVTQVTTKKFSDENKNFNADTSMPWAVELLDGTKCAMLTGATFGVHGMRANYGCVDGHSYLVGDLDRTKSLWTIRKLDGSRLVVVGVGVVWF